jgi:hypothetical protein
MIEKEPLASEMTLRDAVAIAAYDRNLWPFNSTDFQKCAKIAFDVADAFMLERAKRRQ